MFLKKYSRNTLRGYFQIDDFDKRFEVQISTAKCQIDNMANSCYFQYAQIHKLFHFTSSERSQNFDEFNDLKPIQVFSKIYIKYSKFVDLKMITIKYKTIPSKCVLFQ